ncbi:MAG: hypothetical protein F4X84_06165 [Synechococcus sp. SB0662_bin_45]|uniref:Uncharacterized protein n=1 Tax=Synechococcus sp. SB0676_bin_10 TaxID=2604869 RepID=A0A6B1F6A0_9SYNE|nr:hypothetical protein [Cyanobacteria bacterium MAG IRC3_bin_20]MCY3653874.1 hypothetical protein [Cyanobacteria bacterium MAG IRC1_bin_28]MXW12390.1 hypothetical protein [Synechococcus sp. SB0668_bin_13]MXY19404.1 hypothetical protein [Synechococcus sp. SB0664_bin_36]MYE21926.1 hypothetical protein [Synechococcus sp. SB0662_bin_45]MYG38279.1 hypothetical protein [Synechococcus sp. SB0676_bin_10]MYK07973.1 hypothetical protein [Synechococcus sp. SB0670_bin_20]
MGLFDRFRAKPGQAETTSDKPFFLDSDTAQTVGDMSYLRSSNTIRHTFPKSASSPEGGEVVQEVGALGSRVTKVTGGVPEARAAAGSSGPAPVTAPSPGGKVRKTFAQAMSPQELAQRLRGGSVKRRKASAAPQQGRAVPRSLASNKPGSIDPFRSMVRDVTG